MAAGHTRAWWSSRYAPVVACAIALFGLGAVVGSATVLAGRAVGRQAQDGARAEASVMAEAVKRQMQGLTSLIASYAERPDLVSALRDGDPGHYDVPLLNANLRQLHDGDKGIVAAFITDAAGTNRAVYPPAPTVVGVNFSYRDWYQGANSAGTEYVSSAYATATVNHPLVVAVVRALRDPGTGGNAGRVRGILGITYGLSATQDLVSGLIDRQDGSMTVTDQQGVVVARSGLPPPSRLESLRADPRVDAALRGSAGAEPPQNSHPDSYSGWGRVAPIGWAVISEVRATSALATTHDLERDVILIALVMAVILAMLVIWLFGSLRRGDLQSRQIATSEEHFRAVAETAHDGVVSSDASGEITYANRAAQTTFDYTSEELLGRSLTALMPKRFHDAHLAGMARMQETGEGRVVGSTVEVAGERKDGTEFPLELSLASWHSAGDRFFTGVLRDITERRAAAEETSRLLVALRASEGRAFQFLGGLPVGVFVISAQGTPVYANDAAIGMLGKGLIAEATPGLLAEAYSTVVAGTDDPYPSAQMPIVRALEGIEAVVNDMEIVRPDGRLQLEVRGSPILDANGRIIFALASFTDVTEKNQAAAEMVRRASELETSNKELEQFAYVASHDLQEPLRMVASYVALLERKYSDQLDDDAHEFIHYAVDGATRMQTLINDLLVYSRAGRQDRDPTEVDSEATLARALMNLRAVIEERGALVTWDPLPPVMGIETQLVQVFQNLIANALKFSIGPHPTAHIGARRDGTRCTFSVRDHGIGVAPEHAEKIFLMFQRLNKRNDFAGTGIGLAICQKIVSRHGGRIWVESQPGQGATFFFTLPAGEH